MKPTLFLALASSFALLSCTSLDPEYAEYKKQQEAQKTPRNPYGTADPYGAPASNPYGVPGGNSPAGSDVGRYTPGKPAPYQPLPGIPADSSTSRSGFPTIPSPGAPAGKTTTHIVAKGDSLWGLARKYGTTVEAIQQANGLTDTNIMSGTTIQIPTR